MSAEVDITGDVAAIGTLDRQITYATARALTQTAREGRDASIRAIKTTFTTRGQWYESSNRYGVRARAATKENLESQIETAAWWLINHETGQDKLPRRSRALAIPLTGPGKPRPSRSSRVRPEMKPSALGPRAFILMTGSGPMLFYRRAPGDRLTALYTLERRARIRRQSTVIAPTIETVRRRFGPNFSEAIASALATATPADS